MKLQIKCSLGFILICTALSAAFFAWWAKNIHRHRARQALVMDIRAAGGHVWFEHDENRQPIDRVRRLYLASTELDDSIMKRLWLLHEAPVVSFNNTSFSDDDVHYLDLFENLTELKLNRTRITLDGIRHLAQHHRITRITLTGTVFGKDDRELLMELLPDAWELSVPGGPSYLRR